MSFTFLQPPPPPPPPPPRQTITVYPNPVVTSHPPLTPSSSSHHSMGSFGTTLLLLAIVVVVSVVACCLGRLFNRGRDQRHDDHPAREKPRREEFVRGHRGGDVELDFEGRARKKMGGGRVDGLTGEPIGEIRSVAKPSGMNGADFRGDGVETKGPTA